MLEFFRDREVIGLVGPTTRLAVLLAVVLLVIPSSAETAAMPSAVTALGDVSAIVETAPIHHSGDAADDIAIWIHPTDPSRSTIIGTDKTPAVNDSGGGLMVYDLAGAELQYLSVGGINNVDIRYNFPLGGQQTDLVVGGNKRYQSLAAYRVNPGTGLLEDVMAEPGKGIFTGLSPYGTCMYRSQASGRYYAFVTQSPYSNADTGEIQQWELFDNGAGKVDGRKVRTIKLGTDADAEGCVADDSFGHLYITGRQGIWKYSAEPGAGITGTLILPIDGTRLVRELEGITIYHTSQNTGYLIVSSQGANKYVVYRRETNSAGGHDYVTTFRIAAGASIDGVEDTDGIDVSNAYLGPQFPKGVFIAQDGVNDVGNQNFKLVRWDTIASADGLTIDTSWSPRAGITPTPSPTPTPPPAPLVFKPAADARVEEATPDTNFGSDPELRARGGDLDIRSYVRFSVSGVKQSVQRAVLRLYATSNTSDGPALYPTGSNWSESTITWKQVPAVSGNAIADKGSIAIGTWVEYDVTSVVKGDGAYSFLLMSDLPDSLRTSSKEGDNPPQLVVTMGPKQVFLPLIGK